MTTVIVVQGSMECNTASAVHRADLPHLCLKADFSLRHSVCASCPRPKVGELLREQRLSSVAVLGGSEVEIRCVCGRREKGDLCLLLLETCCHFQTVSPANKAENVRLLPAEIL